MGFPLSCGPVSYTHLDVYKRQAFGSVPGAHFVETPVSQLAAGANEDFLTVLLLCACDKWQQSEADKYACLLYTSRCV